MERVELNLHTDMSKMNGFIEIKDYIKKVLQYGMTSIAITDYENDKRYYRSMGGRKGAPDFLWSHGVPRLGGRCFLAF